MSNILVDEQIERQFDEAQVDTYKAQVREAHTIFKDMLSGADIEDIKARAYTALNPKRFTKKEW
ncbi:MAG: hypothetical protein GOVbin2066_6 [Prokaryotic dsDNA virus sp.]|nr:MAG: hypothetical protein GOVbin2066_6 [Prokaryotic dsDNA virus sp.]|tara:strand:+ start:268 stop:459 length:192 start_codon:yes stop_codon:yes gene_type:complete